MTQPNILLFIPDDLGREYIAQYNLLPEALTIPQPNLRSLIANGVKFTRAYSQPWCSPDRAALMTGRYGFKTGIGSLAEAENSPLLETEVCLPHALKIATDNDYACAAFGKWHLSAYTTRGGEYKHPITVGFDHFEGHLRNINSYFSWPAFRATKGRTGVDVQRLIIEDWAPLWFAKRAVDWIKETGTRPWFLWFAMNLPHTPYHKPPDGTYDSSAYVLPNSGPATAVSPISPTFFKAMVQGQDYILGYLRQNIPQHILANTIIIWWSDNGTQAQSLDTTATTGVDLTPYLGAGYSTKVKRSVYELGVNVPMVVSGAGVTQPGRVSSSLISPVDLFKTVIELAGGTYADVPLPSGGTRDSISFADDITNDVDSDRYELLVDQFAPNGPNINATAIGDRALVYRDVANLRDYKLIRRLSTGVTGFPSAGTPAPVSGIEFYDLGNDPLELSNLIAAGYGGLSGAAQTAYDQAVVDYATIQSTL